MRPEKALDAVADKVLSYRPKLIAKGHLFQFGVSPDYVNAPVLIRPWTTGRYGGPSEGVEFVDTRNGKTILLLGTDNFDDYYPAFVCEWSPQNLAEGSRS